MKTVDDILTGLPPGTEVTTFGPGALYDTIVYTLPFCFKEPNLGCYCPSCRTWYDCASSAHANH